MFVKINKEQYAKLLLDQYKLNSLESFGVDNWSWYDYAVEEEDDSGNSYNSMYEDFTTDEIINYLGKDYVEIS